ncbi:MAG: PEGA domain-containing protein [Spirochaetales bacterium]
MKRRTLLFALTLIAIGGLVFAQAKTSLTIQSNQTGARVYINDNLAGYTTPSFSTLVVPGLYRIRVSKDGFPEFKTTVVIGQSPITIMAYLGGSTPPAPPHPQPPLPPPVPPMVKHQLSIDTNMGGAQVYINGAFSGITPFVTFMHPGNYYIVIRLDGYEDYVKTVDLSGSYRIHASLKPLSLPIYIDATNVPGAAIYRDSALIGTVPYRGNWMPGTYSLRVTAPGYADYTERIIVTGPLTMQISLTPLLVDYEIRIPEFFATHEGKAVQFRDMELYLDGKRLQSPFGKAVPGTHRITLIVSDLRFETDFELTPGTVVSLEPFFGINVH